MPSGASGGTRQLIISSTCTLFGCGILADFANGQLCGQLILFWSSKVAHRPSVWLECIAVKQVAVKGVGLALGEARETLI